MLIETETQIKTEVIPALQAAEIAVAFDTETNMTEFYHLRRMMGLSLNVDGQHSFYIPTGHNSWMEDGPKSIPVPSDLLTHIRVPLTSHNVLFDIDVCKRHGIDVSRDLNLYCTMLMAHFIQEERYGFEPFSLDTLSKQYLGKAKEKDLMKTMKANDWDAMPSFAMAKYADQDGLLHFELYQYLKPLFEIYEEAWKIDRQLLFVIQKIVQKGIRIDTRRAQELENLCFEKMSKIQRELGFDPAKSKLLHQYLFEAPPTGLGLIPTNRTPGGKPQVNDAYLENLMHPVAGTLREWRGLQKQVTGYYRPYQRLVDEKGFIHGQFKMHGTVTGRLSGEKPNLTQIPREDTNPHVKKLFQADEGKELWEIDYSALELRLAAAYSDETALLEAFRTGADVHQLTADSCGVVRQLGKLANFLLLYGGGYKKFAKSTGITEELAQQIHTKFHQTYAKMRAKYYAAERSAKANNNSIRLWSGRYRHFRFEGDCYNAWNAICQGGGWEITKRSAIFLDAEGYDIRNLVHDSIWLMLEPGQDIKPAQEIMTGWTEELFGLRFETDAKRLD